MSVLFTQICMLQAINVLILRCGPGPWVLAYKVSIIVSLLSILGPLIGRPVWREVLSLAAPEYSVIKSCIVNGMIHNFAKSTDGLNSSFFAIFYPNELHPSLLMFLTHQASLSDFISVKYD